ncbi:MAG: hypothetical protein KGY76_05520 [Candidatus Thermoplasmatota archaeon]|nr:hypothetical protein [Candidatus Thermoplasmatota archaeon]
MNDEGRIDSGNRKNPQPNQQQTSSSRQQKPTGQQQASPRQQQRSQPDSGGPLSSDFSTKKILTLLLIGMLIVCAGGIISVVSIRSDAPPEEPADDAGSDAWDSYEDDYNEWERKRYSAKNLFKIGLLLVVIGMVLNSIALILGGLKSDLDKGIRQVMIGASVTVMIAILVLILVSPVTGIFSGISGTGSTPNMILAAL